MYYKRDIQKKIEKQIYSDLILLVIGARQTGKTSLLKFYYNKLKSDGHKSYFFNLEDFDYLDLFNKSPKNLLDVISLSDKKVYVFIDEIQYLDNPTNFLKYLYDEHSNRIKFIVTGSSAFYIDSKFKDSLAGRKRIFILNTLNFYEFLFFNGQENLLNYYNPFSFLMNKQKMAIPIKRRLESFWMQYLLFGGYPRVVLADDRNEKIEILRELVNSFIKKDISESGLKRPEKFYRLLKMVSAQVGNLVNINSLSNDLNLSFTAVENYLIVMEKSFHISIIKPFHKNIRKELTKMPKVYFNDTGLRNILINNFEDLKFRPDSGALFENIVYKSLLSHFTNYQIKFWRTQSGNEIDFILDEKLALEVKLNINQFKISKYKKFMNAYDFPFKVIYRYGENDQISDDRIEIFDYLDI